MKYHAVCLYSAIVFVLLNTSTVAQVDSLCSDSLIFTYPSPPYVITHFECGCNNKKLNDSIARIDWKKGQAVFHIVGMFTICFDSSNFQRKYHIRYIHHGCVSPGSACIELYNQQIATYLDQKYGLVWRNEVCDYVSGLGCPNSQYP